MLAFKLHYLPRSCQRGEMTANELFAKVIELEVKVNYYMLSSLSTKTREEGRGAHL